MCVIYTYINNFLYFCNKEYITQKPKHQLWMMR